MTVKQQWMAVAGIVAVLAVGLFVGSRMMHEESFHVGIGSQAPGFNAIDMSRTDGSLKTLSDYRGKVVLLNIWATWCGPCREEMPSMEQLHKAFDGQGLAVVAVSVDNRDMDKAIRDFVKEFSLTFDVLHDREELFRAVYPYRAVPETYVIDKSGTVRRKWIGPDDWNSESNRKFIAQLLAESEA